MLTPCSNNVDGREEEEEKESFFCLGNLIGSLSLRCTSSVIINFVILTSRSISCNLSYHYGSWCSAFMESLTSFKIIILKLYLIKNVMFQSSKVACYSLFLGFGYPIAKHERIKLLLILLHRSCSLSELL